MFGEIFSIIILIFITLIPIVIWGYLFSYFDDSVLNRKRFAVGILAGGISVFPILYLEDFILKTDFSWLNIFQNISSLYNFSDLVTLSISFLGILFFILIIPFLFFLGYNNIKQKILNFLRDYFVFSLYIIIFGLGVFFTGKIFDFFELGKENYNFGLKFGDVFFNSFKLVIFYYLLIGLIEELSKFFCFNYSKLFSQINLRQTILYAIFVALGFAFLENILYFYRLYEAKGLGKDLVFVYFSRNIFSVVLHVLCSSIFAYYFGKFYLKLQENLTNIKFFKIMFLGFILAVALHAIFDIFLTFGLTFFIVIYLLGAYFYLTYIFYKE